MPKGYTHLAYEQRCQIYVLLKRNISKNQIAATIGVHQSTVSREILRNKGGRGYRYKQAQAKANGRRLNASSQNRKLTPDLTFYVKQMLCEFQWSPEQIAGRLHTIYGITLSHESIYRYIWNDKKMGGKVYKHLRRSGKRYNKRSGKQAGRGLIPGRIGIEARPAIVERKERVGDLELDTIIGAQHRGAIVSIVDRKTKLTLLKLLPNATADETSNAIIELLKPIKDNLCTLTSDNGKEFAQHERVSKELNAKFFFANPYRSCERGLNENTNGLVRQYFPKKSVFAKLTHDQVKKVEFLLNSRPRKLLKYRTPLEVFFQETGKNLSYALQC